MRVLFLTVLGIIVWTTGVGQSVLSSFRESRRIDSLWYAGKVDAVIDAYRNILAGSPDAQMSRYNLACAFARIHKPDSAFKHLGLLLAAGQPTDDALTDADLLELRKDKRWTAFETQTLEAMQLREHLKIRDLDYARKLWVMHARDQAYYFQILLSKPKEGPAGPTAKRLWAKKDSLNKLNQQELVELVRAKGWPTYSQVGHAAADAAFLVIQHADSAMQRRYLPEILALCKTGEASWESYALMYDRLEMACNRPQRYGSQIRSDEKTGARWIYRLEDPAKVDAWRREAGLEPMNVYAQRFGLSFP